MPAIPWCNNPTTYGTTVVSVGAKFGENVTIYQNATVCDEAVIGNNVVIGSSVWIGRGVTIGDGTRIQHGAFIPNQTQIGRNVFVGPNATLTDDKYPRVNKAYKPQPPILEDNCSLGAGCVILPGVRIGRSAMCGAGSVVCRDVPSGTVVVGCPAKVTNAHHYPNDY